MKALQSIKFWVFDLDNTLYSAKTRVFEQVSNRMTQYVSNKLRVDLDKAKEIQRMSFPLQSKQFHDVELTILEVGDLQN